MIVGFGFTKVGVERHPTQTPVQKVRVVNDVDIKDVRETPLPVNNRKAVSVDFEFIIKYEPNVAQISIAGSVLYMGDDAKVKATIEGWKKTKKLDKDVSVEILNMVLAKCNIKALELSQDVNLPTHLPLPRVTPPKEKPSDYIG